MNTLILALGFAFLLCVLMMVSIGIYAMVFSVKFKKLLNEYDSVCLPEYKGYAFGRDKMERQKRYRKYFMSREYRKETEPKLRHLGAIGRRLYMVLFVNTSVAFLVAICFAILNMYKISK